MRLNSWIKFGFFSLTVFLSCSARAEDLVSVQGAFLRGEYEKVLRSNRGDFPEGSDGADTLLYLKGVSALKLGDGEMARSLLTKLVENRPRSRWAAQGWLALGESWELSGKPDEALKVYSRYLEEGADSSLRPQVLLRVGIVQREMGLWEEAKKTLEGAAAQEAGSAVQMQAADILKSGEFYFTVQVGAFAAVLNAQRLAAELKRRGYDSAVSQTSAQGRVFHRVRIGRFSSRTEAEQEARRLQQDGFPAKVFP